MIIKNTCFGVFRACCDSCRNIASLEYQSDEVVSMDEVFARCLLNAGWTFTNIYCTTLCPDCATKKECSHD